jgi:hypothetical protein
MVCELCGYITRNRFCNFCDKLYFKEEKNTHFNRTFPIKHKKIAKPLSEKNCEKCGCVFKQRNSRQKFCSDECRNPTQAEKWLNKKRKSDIPKSISHDFLSRSHCCKNECSGWTKKFKSVRG